jgi:hypothetical protein
MGKTQLLPTGGAFVGWGSQPNFSEYSGSGQLILDVVLPTPDISYRANLHQWVGLPLYPPVGAARQQGGKTTVYASWNGATRVASWRVLGGPSPTALAQTATSAKLGFETAIPVRQSYKTFKVEALDANGRVIGTSRLFGGHG